MKKFLALILALVMALSLVACGGDKGEEAEKPDAPTQGEESAKPEGETYKVGVVLPMTGGSARNGELQYEGIKLFADYYNDVIGGIQSMNGMKIELVLADSAGDPATGASEAERLINNEKVDALMGPYNSSVGAVMQPIAEKNGVPFIVTNCTANNVMMSDGDLKYTFRANVAQSFQVTLWWELIEFLNSKQPADDQMDKFAIVYENTDYGQGVVDNFGNCLTEAGYELTVCESFETGTADFSSTINKIKAADVDWVIPAMYVSDAQLFLQ